MTRSTTLANQREGGVIMTIQFLCNEIACIMILEIGLRETFSTIKIPMAFLFDKHVGVYPQLLFEIVLKRVYCK